MSEKHPHEDAVLSWFEAVSQHPRGSGHEQALRAFLETRSAELGFPTRTDRIGNLLVEVPASPGAESAPRVILQGHLDMVCEKSSDSAHDFRRDPIRVIRDGDWIHADGTTLGADNGIAVALGFALAEAPEVRHPPMDLLFTVQEETGLAGAMGLDPSMLRGDLLLNLDTEEEGMFTVGCAGARTTLVGLPVARDPIPAGHVAAVLAAGGMVGGHSGVDIHKRRANAIKVLARVLGTLRRYLDLRVVTVSGGKAHNAIPREAEAVITIPGELRPAAAIIDGLAETLRAEHRLSDPDLSLIFAPAPMPRRAFSAATTRRVLDFLSALPDGVADYSAEIAGAVETSSNLASVAVLDGHLTALASQRGSRPSRLELHTDSLEAVARLAGGTVERLGGYGPWAPKLDSSLLRRATEVYLARFGRSPGVMVVHAGLECGALVAKRPGLEVISLGPNIEQPHSPAERLHVPSLGRIWDFLAALLGSYADDRPV